VLVSALTGAGLDRLTGEIETRLAAGRVTIELILDPADGAGLSWLHRHTEVISRGMGPDGRLAVVVRADPANADRVRAKFGLAVAAPH
jgi:GTP-binding protein HflX